MNRFVIWFVTGVFVFESICASGKILSAVWLLKVEYLKFYLQHGYLN